jgi:hypothetical protein
MLGEILGRSAGEIGTELTLPRFLELLIPALRGRSWGVFFEVAEGSAELEPGSSWGLFAGATVAVIVEGLVIEGDGRGAR